MKINTKDMMPLFHLYDAAVIAFDNYADYYRRASDTLDMAKRLHVEHKEDALYERIEDDACRIHEFLDEYKERKIMRGNAFDAGTVNLTNAISAAEGKARSRTITAYTVLAKLAEITTSLNIPKTRMEGITVSVDLNAETFSNAYINAAHGSYPQSTIFTAEFKRGNWIITDIFRGNCRRHCASITLPDAAREAIINRIENGNI